MPDDPTPAAPTPDDPTLDVAAEQLFLALLDAPEDARARMLATARPDAAREAMRLLDALSAAGPFLGSMEDSPLTALLADDETLDDEEDGLAPGTAVGPWRIVREAGRGGMGRVYLAERTDGAFEQRVALKMVRPDAGGRRFAARFERERRILARLEHPGIARVVDGGATVDGQPYLAMAFADGEPITAYCDRRRLSIAERLALVEAVVAAVAYAHRRLVVHRDLKPSNVFAADGPDGTPVATLLDFGLATLLDDSPGDALAASPDAPLTGPLGMVLTPEYAAPEQVTGEPATTATDVYALGVLLYELLAGERPYRFARRTPAEIERVVTTVEPPRPSLAAPEEAAAPRATTPRGLRRALAGDLDTLVLTALSKDPARRYASAEALGEDLRRHRLGLPLRARATSAAYRAVRFARRNRVLVGAVVAVIAALGVGLAATLVQARAARAEGARAEAARDLLVGLFDPADPNTANADSVSARTLLDSAGVRIERDLAGQPALQADMGALFGRILFRLNAPEAALPLFERADARVQRLPAGAVANPGSARAGVGMCLLHTGGDVARASRLIADGYAAQRAARGAGDPEAIGIALTLDQLWRMTGDTERADSLLLASHAALDASPPTAAGREARASLFGALASAQYERGEPRAAIASAREAVRFYTAAGRARDAAGAETTLGLALMGAGDLGEADRVLRSARAHAGIRGETTETVVIDRMIARLLADRGDVDAAGRLLLSAAAHAEASGNALVAAPVYGEWATVLARDGRVAEAEDALAHARTLLPPSRASAAAGWQANVDLAAGRFAAARSGFEQDRERFPVSANLGIGQAYDREGRTADAIRAYRAAAQASTDHFTTALHLALIDFRLGDALVRTGTRAEGSRLLARADSATTAMLGPANPTTRRVRAARARLR